MKKLTSALVLAVFGFNCWFAWAMLNLVLDVKNGGKVLPYFTNLCIDLKPLLLFLPIVALACGLRLWFRKAEIAPSLAHLTVITMTVQILFVFPVILSSYWLILDPVKFQAMR
jgi:hypothetical protein